MADHALGLGSRKAVQVHRCLANEAEHAARLLTLLYNPYINTLHTSHNNRLLKKLLICKVYLI